MTNQPQYPRTISPRITVRDAEEEERLTENFRAMLAISEVILHAAHNQPAGDYHFVLKIRPDGYGFSIEALPPS